VNGASYNARKVRQLPAVIKHVLTRKTNTTSKAQLEALMGTASNGVEDPMNESSAEYSRRLGRWRNDVLSIFEDTDFFHVLEIVEASHRPLQHHMGFVSKVLSASELEAHGGHIAQLLSGKGEQILNECFGFLRDIQWARDITNQVSSPEDVSDLFALALEVHLHHAAAYKRRVVDFLNRWHVFQ
jgi:hypothetical protein